VRALQVDERVTIPATDLSWTAVRASGPGGQNVNKVASKVELRFELAQCAVLSPAVKARMFAACKSRLDAEGRVRIVSQATRDQGQNLEDARDKLAALVRAALTVPKPRTATKPTRGSKRRRLLGKHKQAEKKAMRGRVREGD
jgi:ribosome-associated protein